MDPKFFDLYIYRFNRNNHLWTYLGELEKVRAKSQNAKLSG